LSSGWHRKNLNTDAERARRAKYQSAEHKAARKHYKTLVERGVILRCWRCGARIVPGNWHVGHDDVNVNLIRGPECATCNKKAAASKGAKVTNAQRKMRGFTRRAW
jgi:hypothetical protein